MKPIRWTVALLVLTLAEVGCRLPAPPGTQPITPPARQTIVLYAFSVQEEVMTQEIVPAFQAYWQETAGQEVTFRTVFTGSEQIAAEIIKGAPADAAILSNEQHAVWLRVTDRVETDWQTFPQQGTVSKSPIVIVVRPGNPLGINDWHDLTNPEVKLVHANPSTSGGAQWALLAEYGSALLVGGGKSEEARDQLRGIWANVVVTPPSSREALKEFMFGTGDALVTYEQDALLAQSRGASLEVVAPHSTFVSEHVAVIVDCNVKPWERQVVEAFVDFLWSDSAQRAFTRYYYRSVTDASLNEAVSEFYAIEEPFLAADLGGWGRAYPEIIEGVWAEQSSAQ